MTNDKYNKMINYQATANITLDNTIHNLKYPVRVAGMDDPNEPKLQSLIVGRPVVCRAEEKRQGRADKSSVQLCARCASVSTIERGCAGVRNHSVSDSTSSSLHGLSFKIWQIKKYVA